MLLVRRSRTNLAIAILSTILFPFCSSFQNANRVAFKAISERSVPVQLTFSEKSCRSSKKPLFGTLSSFARKNYLLNSREYLTRNYGVALGEAFESQNTAAMNMKNGRDTTVTRGSLFSVLRQRPSIPSLFPQSRVTGGKSSLYQGLRNTIRKARLRRRLATVLIALAFAFGSSTSAMAGGSGGRMGGGSFKSSPSRSSRSSYSGRSSTLSRPPAGRINLPPPRLNTHRHGMHGMGSPAIGLNSFSNRGSWYGRPDGRIESKFTGKDLVVLTGSGAMIFYGVRNNYRNKSGQESSGSLLGPGVTVASLTVCLDVPNRRDSDNILTKLSRLANEADTVSQQGIQDMLSSVALELLRQEKAITSVYTQTYHFPIIGQAEREFQLLSVEARSKVDRLTVNKFGSKNSPDARVSNEEGTTLLSPTMAIVSLNFAIEGDSTRLNPIRNRDDLRGTLASISSDAQVGDCLLTAEIMWSPEDNTETLTRETTYADYPNLVPI